MAWESPDRQGPGLEWLWVQVSWSEIRVSETHWSEWRQYSGGSEWDGVQVSEESVVEGVSEIRVSWSEILSEWGQCSGGSEWGQKERIIAGRSRRLSPLARHSHAPTPLKIKRKWQLVFNNFFWEGVFHFVFNLLTCDLLLLASLYHTWTHNINLDRVIYTIEHKFDPALADKSLLSLVKFLISRAVLS